MSKQLRTIESHIVCDVCRRTILRGERPEHYLAPSRERKLVCELCGPRAQREGWIREAAAPALAAVPPRPREGRGLLSRARRRIAAAQAARDEELGLNGAAGATPEPGAPGDGAPAKGRRTPRFQREDGHVRAVPTSAQLKIERAVDLFNESEHPRTISGIARSLGAPSVSAATSRDSTAQVVITVAWDISWYRFVVDLADASEPVRLDARGQELSELTEATREWNATAEEDGMVSFARAVTTPATNGDRDDEDL